VIKPPREYFVVQMALHQMLMYSRIFTNVRSCHHEAIHVR
jgi:hypothetical protein